LCADRNELWKLEIVFTHVGAGVLAEEAGLPTDAGLKIKEMITPRCRRIRPPHPTARPNNAHHRGARARHCAATAGRGDCSR